jgi:AP-2 complex subunit alpha
VFILGDKPTTQWFIRTSQSFVKKKAALTLLRLYRKHPEVIPAAEWALRIVSIMDDHDLVILS